MKRMIAIVAILTMMLVMLSGCSATTIKQDWVSSDGVHYWIAFYGSSIGLAPRYDHNGNLMIDGE